MFIYFIFIIFSEKWKLIKCSNWNKYRNRENHVVFTRQSLFDNGIFEMKIELKFENRAMIRNNQAFTGITSLTFCITIFNMKIKQRKRMLYLMYLLFYWHNEFNLMTTIVCISSLIIDIKSIFERFYGDQPHIRIKK